MIPNALLLNSVNCFVQEQNTIWGQSDKVHTQEMTDWEKKLSSATENVTFCAGDTLTLSADYSAVASDL